MKHSEIAKKLGNLLGDLAYSESYHKAFEYLLDGLLYNLITYDECGLRRNPLEKLDKSKHQVLAEAMVCLGEVMEENGGLYDALGDLFMEHVSGGKNGQFFTPQHICDGIARMQIPSNVEKSKTVTDPTCGSGRMLLAGAKINKDLIFFGSDIDHNCVKMSVVNLALNNLVGEIVWGDPLKLETYASYRIERMPITGFPIIRVYKESIQFPKVEKQIEKVKPKQTEHKQLSLF
ncbi:N-6 DNA methylase [Riemerella columbina]|uniref:N-6 DNA methylase n=1 Tax=Riemerella columbina TaxID=103810 RepID=UPI000374B54B|nr:N-6 DNA methylase [Riemerella columbina]